MMPKFNEFNQFIGFVTLALHSKDYSFPSLSPFALSGSNFYVNIKLFSSLICVHPDLSRGSF